MPDLTILLVSGSARDGSTNTAVLRTAAALTPPGVRAMLYDGLSALRLFNPDDDREDRTVDERVARMRGQVAAADALLICTPEYAGALPAAMKNLLEWTIGDAGTYRKPVAFINAAGPAAPTGAADAHESLRRVLAYAGADLVHDACARIPVSRDLVGPTGVIADEAVRREIALVVARLAEHARTAALSPQVESDGNIG